MNCYWLSFVDPEAGEFLGATAVLAGSPEDAIEMTWTLDINPGGEVAVAEVPSDQITPEILEMFFWARGRLVSKQELNDRGEFSEADKRRAREAHRLLPELARINKDLSEPN
jgi:hypothetical protein